MPSDLVLQNGFPSMYSNGVGQDMKPIEERYKRKIAHLCRKKGVRGAFIF